MSRPAYYLTTHPGTMAEQPCGSTGREIRTDIRTDRGAMQAARNSAKARRRPVFVWYLPDVYCDDADERVRMIGTAYP